MLQTRQALFAGHMICIKLIQRQNSKVQCCPQKLGVNLKTTMMFALLFFLFGLFRAVLAHFSDMDALVQKNNKVAIHAVSPHLF